MANKKDIDEMEMERKILRGIITTAYKRPLWDRFKDTMGIFFMACFILLVIAVVVFLIALLIENPVSLAILCITIFLIWAWGNR